MSFDSLQALCYDRPPAAGEIHLHDTLRRIDEIANKDVEMQAPLSENLSIVVLDTNILLEYLDVVRKFVEEVESQNIPVLLIIPGAVIYELDGQKNRDGLSWFARRASTWLLKKVKERKCVKGQALDETCKPSRNWKKREIGESSWDERRNDSLILDCCQYFSRIRHKRTVLCSKDKLLAVEAESEGIQNIYPTGQFCSRAIAHALYGPEAGLFRFSGHRPNYKNSSIELTQVHVEQEDDGMDIDDDASTTETLQPSHALDLLHLQVIEHFGQLLVELVMRVGGPELQECGEGVSRHAPRHKLVPFSQWGPRECCEYLGGKKRSRISQRRPRLDVFLTKPYADRGARRGQDWSRRDWEVAMQSLGDLGEEWQEGTIQESIPSVQIHMERVFSMPMRPTGL
ncbi:hypothetical protein CONPUDRAFT_81645 [Coniophora puteana RWD-64-598 SS2]|uniref:PIN domain-containing protein n=1 Tax=Coniophora puteana (strain RWD-64-598) TaxID=741705 RepID=A0A5M3MSF6_CONPW|nr:uncharacterized protein CONPUDRAFT_81645 [Coniophora puteana RWD-64-598 SS2]EIW82098.1 hypothetical protein CONPUDRAFT_81645 [Coniophora puteana RWD-64-598 SS2]